mmetsp:Transcript_8176/g.50827  ORF Transcript_8176/g.50827 Transcript_8176/m.50827 type:complete len:232 (+) Transcript_8176:1698-2393(+)
MSSLSVGFLHLQRLQRQVWHPFWCLSCMNYVFPHTSKSDVVQGLFVGALFVAEHHPHGEILHQCPFVRAYDGQVSFEVRLEDGLSFLVHVVAGQVDVQRLARPSLASTPAKPFCSCVFPTLPRAPRKPILPSLPTKLELEHFRQAPPTRPFFAVRSAGSVFAPRGGPASFPAPFSTLPIGFTRLWRTAFGAAFAFSQPEASHQRLLPRKRDLPLRGRRRSLSIAAKRCHRT